MSEHHYPETPLPEFTMPELGELLSALQSESGRLHREFTVANAISQRDASRLHHEWCQVEKAVQKVTHELRTRMRKEKKDVPSRASG